MFEIEALSHLLFEKGIITEEEFIERHKKLDMEIEEKGKVNISSAIRERQDLGKLSDPVRSRKLIGRITRLSD